MNVRRVIKQGLLVVGMVVVLPAVAHQAEMPQQPEVTQDTQQVSEVRENNEEVTIKKDENLQK